MKHLITLILIILFASCSPCKIEHYHLRNENAHLKAALKYNAQERKKDQDSIKKLKRRIEKQN